MEDELQKKWKMTSKKNIKKRKMNNNKNGRRPQKNKNERQPQKKMKKNEDDIKKNLFLIHLKFRANLSWDWLSSLRFWRLKKRKRRTSGEH